MRDTNNNVAVFNLAAIDNRFDLRCYLEKLLVRLRLYPKRDHIANFFSRSCKRVDYWSPILSNFSSRSTDAIYEGQKSDTEGHLEVSQKFFRLLGMVALAQEFFKAVFADQLGTA